MAKIYLVDDDPLLVRMYQKKLELDGHSVTTASNGEEAVKGISPAKADLVLLDVMMPKMNGIEVLKKLKSNESTKSIPVVMLTNVSSRDANTDKALELGAVAYLVKSNYTPKEVVKKVKELLKASTSEVPEVEVPVKEGDEKENK